MRRDASKIRVKATDARVDLKRYSKNPNWELLRKQVLEPLHRLREQVNDELAQIESDEKQVPIDRDPVPRRYAEQVRQYYERLGSGQ